MAGTTWTLAMCAISSNPLRRFMSCPVREISPSVNTHTSSPFLSAATAPRSHWEGLSLETGMTPARS